MQAIVLKSNPGTRFRFGEALGAFKEETHNAQKSTSHYLHSDTLWSALVNTWALSAPTTVENFIDECINGKFKLSSAFYCVEYMGNNVFFLPKPVSLNLFLHDDPKKLKKIKFISKGVWESGLIPKDWFNTERCTLLQNESIVALKSEIDTPVELFAIETSPKTHARDITEREDSFYYEIDLFLSHSEKHKTDWYFLLENNMPENLQNDFQTAMKTLVNLGIGGERTTGSGSLFEFQVVELAFNPVETSNYRASVSLIAPNENELSENSLYQIIKRGGRFLENGKCLPMIQMLLEGAVFDTGITGKIVALNQEPPILRYGLNFSVLLHKNFINK